MKPLHAIYKDAFFRRRYKLYWRTPVFCQAVVAILEPKSIIDVGCATGEFVQCFENDFGIRAMGIEGSTHAFNHAVTDKITLWDLRLPYLPETKYDLCMSLEVSEHIEPEYTDVYIQTLVDLSDRILFSAAPPGQRGLYHVNCQHPQYWHDTFAEYGYKPNERIVALIRIELFPWRKKIGVRAFYQNLLYYERGKT